MFFSFLRSVSDSALSFSFVCVCLFTRFKDFTVAARFQKNTQAARQLPGLLKLSPFAVTLAVNGRQQQFGEPPLRLDANSLGCLVVSVFRHTCGKRAATAVRGTPSQAARQLPGLFCCPRFPSHFGKRSTAAVWGNSHRTYLTRFAGPPTSPSLRKTGSRPVDFTKSTGKHLRPLHQP